MRFVFAVCLLWCLCWSCCVCVCVVCSVCLKSVIDVCVCRLFGMMVVCVVLYLFACLWRVFVCVRSLCLRFVFVLCVTVSVSGDLCVFGWWSFVILFVIEVCA